MRGRRGLYSVPTKPARPMSAHERVVAQCIADGLIDSSHNITAAGHQWCDALLLELDKKEQLRGQRFNPDNGL